MHVTAIRLQQCWASAGCADGFLTIQRVPAPPPPPLPFFQTPKVYQFPVFWTLLHPVSLSERQAVWLFRRRWSWLRMRANEREAGGRSSWRMPRRRSRPSSRCALLSYSSLHIACALACGCPNMLDHLPPLSLPLSCCTHARPHADQCTGRSCSRQAAVS